MAAYPINAEEKVPMRTGSPSHSTLGVLWIAYGVICIAKAAWLAVYHATLHVMWGTIINRVADPYAWIGVFHILLLTAICLSSVTAVLSVAAGLTLMRPSLSRRNLPVVASIFGILTGPLGTALGVYTLILVVPRPVWQMYDRISSAA